jgi:short-subunit dehydrogenase
MNVLITGASGGLGRELAMDCARRGYDLFLTDIHAPALEAISAGIIRRYGVRVYTKACDLTQPEAVKGLLDSAKDKGVVFDMLLNVAGIDCEGGFTERSADELMSMIGINVEATISLTHQVLECRGKNAQGKHSPFYIVFVSSLASLYPMPLKAAYAASKRFLYDFAYALGSELKPQGVNVTTLCPGGLATNAESIAGIAAQGFWGNLTTSPVETIARKTINKVLRGRRTYIPGILNSTLGAAGKILPRALIAWAIRMRWEKARSIRTDLVTVN